MKNEDSIRQVPRAEYVVNFAPTVRGVYFRREDHARQ